MLKIFTIDKSERVSVYTVTDTNQVTLEPETLIIGMTFKGLSCCPVLPLGLPLTDYEYLLLSTPRVLPYNFRFSSGKTRSISGVFQEDNFKYFTDKLTP